LHHAGRLQHNPRFPSIAIQSPPLLHSPPQLAQKSPSPLSLLPPRPGPLWPFVPLVQAGPSSALHLLIRGLDNRLHPFTVRNDVFCGDLLHSLAPALALPPNTYLTTGGRPLRPGVPLRELGLTHGSTIDVQLRLLGGAPEEPPGKRPRPMPRSEAATALHSFFSGAFQAWRPRVPPAELARDVARLVTRWSAAGLDTNPITIALAESLGIPSDQVLEVLWAWEVVCGWTYDPQADTFSQSAPMEVDPPGLSPLEEVARLRRELERVTQEAASLRAQACPPLSEANLLQLLGAAPATPWVHALGEALLHALRAEPPIFTPSLPSPTITFINGVWNVLQQFALAPTPTFHTPPAGAAAPLPTNPTQGVCFNCGLPGHWARNCRQQRHSSTPASSSTLRQGALSVLPSGQTVFTAASGRTYDVAGNPPYPCGRCQQLHWFFQPCPSRPQPF
jgi:hypothetical protein